MKAGVKRWLFPAEAAELAVPKSFRLVLRGIRGLGSQNPSFWNAVVRFDHRFEDDKLKTYST